MFNTGGEVFNYGVCFRPPQFDLATQNLADKRVEPVLMLVGPFARSFTF